MLACRDRGEHGEAANRQEGAHRAQATCASEREPRLACAEARRRRLDPGRAVYRARSDSPGDIETFVAKVIGGSLATTKTRPKGEGVWQYFLDTERPHPGAQHCWLGFGAGLPPKIVDTIQASLEAHGCVCSREFAVIAHHALRPLFALTAGGIEVPLGATSPSDATLGRLAAPVSRKPFVVELADILKKDLLGAILLGDGRPFQLRYFQEDSLASIRFVRVDLQMFASQGYGSFTAMTKYTAAPPCVLGFEFHQPQLAEMLGTLPDHVAEGLSDALAQGRPFRVAPGTVVVGVFCRPAPPDGTEGSSFIVEQFAPSTGTELVARF
jgi:hypothetical protein